MRELRTLLPFLRPYRRSVLLGLILVVVSNVFAIFLPRLLGLAIDALRARGASYDVVLKYAVWIVVLALVSGAARYGMRELLNGFSRHVEQDLRHAFYDQLLRLDATFYSSARTGDLMSRAVNDTGAVRQAAGPAVMYFANTIVSTALSLVFMLPISPHLTLYALIPMGLLPPVMVFFGRRIHRQSEEIQDYLGIISTMVQENLAGVRIVRAYVQEDVQNEEFRSLNRTYLDKNMRLAHSVGVFNPLLTVLAGAGTLIVLWLGGREALQGRISPGDFIAFMLYVSMLTWPMIALGWVINLFQRGAASMARLNKIFAIQPVVQDKGDAIVLPEIRGEVEFRDVHFTYPGSTLEVLRGISFRVPAGSTVAIVGPTGSGKSTIISLLTRSYDPDHGVVMLDGVPLTGISLAHLRRSIGVVPQDAFVFSRTIEQNIAFGITDDAEKGGRVEQAARIAQLDETIQSFPWGYQTRLGERGVNLSGGQRQRATLARAIARDPRILILDDSLSAVDTHTETAILRGLREVLRGRTSFIVSHRVTAVMSADVILVLDNGRIVEQGTHSELVARSGLYASLLRRQLLEEDLEVDQAV